MKSNDDAFHHTTLESTSYGSGQSYQAHTRGSCDLCSFHSCGRLFNVSRIFEPANERQVRYWKHPLRGVPGPVLARFTGIWLLRHELAGTRATTIHELHQMYGPVVRIAPDQLSFSSPAALREIYGSSSKYAKAPVYDSMGFQSTFTTRDRNEYRTMKKRILPNFSPSAIAALEPTVHKHVAGLVKVFERRADAPIDIFPWVRMVALCVVGKQWP